MICEDFLFYKVAEMEGKLLVQLRGTVWCFAL